MDCGYLVLLLLLLLLLLSLLGEDYFEVITSKVKVNSFLLKVELLFLDESRKSQLSFTKMSKFCKVALKNNIFPEGRHKIRN